MTDPTPEPADHDGRWKDALHDYLDPCIALFWPQLHRHIDFRQAPVFLDKELQSVGGARRRGRRLLDKLVRLRLSDGAQTLLLLHLEIQARVTADFGERMFVYHYRLRERHPHDRLMQAAILTRSTTMVGAGFSTYRYLPFDDGSAGSLELRFPVVHLPAWVHERPALAEEARHNPFAVVALAELAAGSARSPQDRYASKLKLVRMLYAYGYAGDDVRRLFTFIDGVLALTPQQEPAFLAALADIEGEHQVAYITSVERAGIRKGLAQGIEQGREQGREQGLEQGLAHGRVEGMRQLLLMQLEARFGAVPAQARRRVDSATAQDLQRWSLAILGAASIDEALNEA
ncbi:hypothetical protein FOZ76_00375 [Verticiella sediminum]|uniref:DUF4351 domain-containing protein n=1 Tax=Verticiella sediminum TaxID=1247510 RepID=A0A556B238_9BURK|nr:hypothetical protein [Verticiella sediminum]TSH99224.1 hypothetical protein FOZ76_00375 [Verticiella sediminum]